MIKLTNFYILNLTSMLKSTDNSDYEDIKELSDPEDSNNDMMSWTLFHRLPTEI